MDYLAPLVVLAAGFSLALQQVLNASLGSALQSARWSALVSYCRGTVALQLLLLAVREPAPDAALAGRAHWMAWTGGVFGAMFIGTSIYMVPRFGVTTVATLIIVGQLLSSLASFCASLQALRLYAVSLSATRQNQRLPSGLAPGAGIQRAYGYYEHYREAESCCG